MNVAEAFAYLEVAKTLLQGGDLKGAIGFVRKSHDSFPSPATVLLRPLTGA